MGSVVGGWRRFVDLHCTGKVGEKVFARALNQLKMSDQVGMIWRSLRPTHNYNPVTIHEIAPSEAQNMENFAEALWRHCGGNIDIAWGILDHQGHNYLILEDFEAACHRLGFRGDHELVFRGLGDIPMNRFTKEDLAYMQKVTKITHDKLQDVPKALHEFTMWATVSFASPEAFITKLGLTNENPAISVSELCARLTALGYDGDALTISNRAARLEGGTYISAPSLHLLLTGSRRTPFVLGSERIPMVKSCEKQPLAERPVWNSSCDEQAVHNRGQSKKFPTPKGQRMYFSVPQKGDKSKPGCALADAGSPPTARAASLERSRSMPPEKRRASQIRRHEVLHLRTKPLRGAENLIQPDPLVESQVDKEKDWDGRIVDYSKQNARQGKNMKGCFSETFERPYKDMIIMQMSENKQKRDRARADANREEFSKPWPSRFNFLTQGEKVLIRLQEVMDGNQSRVRDLMVFDIDGRGKVDKDELGEGLASMGFDLSPQELESMFKFVDDDGNGTIEPKEITKAMRAAVRRARSVLGDENKKPRSGPNGPATPRLTPRSLTPR